VVTIEGVKSEGGPGGFGAVYDVYRAMEQAGKVRRGYFVEGHGATQLALPGADDRLRSLRQPPSTPHVVVLAATDPASPYGASAPWPALPGGEGGRPQRAPGAYVVLRDGALLGWLARGGTTLLTFGNDVGALASALGGLVDSGKRRAILLARIDQDAAASSPHVAAFRAAGFSTSTRGLLRRRTDASFLTRREAVQGERSAR
jgi:ATP-dependent Lhr-like helicase